MRNSKLPRKGLSEGASQIVASGTRGRLQPTLGGVAMPPRADLLQQSRPTAKKEKKKVHGCTSLAGRPSRTV